MAHVRRLKRTPQEADHRQGDTTTLNKHAARTAAVTIVVVLSSLIGLQAKAHEPPVAPAPEVLCSLLATPPKNCEAEITAVIKAKLKRIAEDARRREKRTSRPKDTTYRGMGTDVERWRPLVSEFFGEQTDLALCVMLHESGGNPNAKNPRSSARGLFQILASLWAEPFGVSYEDLYDPTINVHVAKQIHSLQGWSAWAAYNRGKC